MNQRVYQVRLKNDFGVIFFDYVAFSSALGHSCQVDDVAALVST
jgi:hypothetical protein